jgi:hypothetical protein
VRFALQLSGLILTGSVIAGTAAFAADATTPVDPKQRNGNYAPSGATTLPTDKKTPLKNETVQEKRVEKTTIEKQLAPAADRKSSIDVTETRDKVVREKDSHRPEVREQPTSNFNNRKAAISTASDTTKPPTVKRYQDSLAAASVSNMARFPAMDRATSAKINRFVFRKNPVDASGSVDPKSATRAGGDPMAPK